MPKQTENSDPGRPGSCWRGLLALLGVTLFIVLVDNRAFFGTALEATQGNQHQPGIVLSLFLLVATTLFVLLALVSNRWLFKPVAAALLIISAAAAYFMNNYGVIFDASMIRNMVETDAREASTVVTLSFFMHVGIFGLVPAALLALIPLGGHGWKREFLLRTGCAAVLGLVTLGVIRANYGPLSFFAHQNHAVRMEINPLYPLYAIVDFATRESDKPVAERLPLVAVRDAGAEQADKPLLLVFIMGETARADRFSLNGYERDTNRFTRELDVIDFPDVSACGTSTADSVPCIFSRFGHNDFSHAGFAENESLYQALERLGISTTWLDNSTGCKDVCDADLLVDLAGASDPRLCQEDVCIDEILLQNFRERVQDTGQDRFMVLHQRGSHGPAYYLDTPGNLKTWLPECDTPSLQNCDAASIANAYDNTILYTDYFIARVIEQLQQESARYRTALIYVSDHGESLGEHGLYLHGLPYVLAPPEQKKVPMLFWASEDFYASRAMDRDCLRTAAEAPTSHDAIFHTILGVFDIASPVYDRELDLFASCTGAVRPIQSRI